MDKFKIGGYMLLFFVAFSLNVLISMIVIRCDETAVSDEICGDPESNILLRSRLENMRDCLLQQADLSRQYYLEIQELNKALWDCSMRYEECLGWK